MYKLYCLLSLLCLPIFAADDAMQLLCYGDSLTAGYGVAKEKSWPSLLEEKLKQSNVKSQVINAGVSGRTSAGGLSGVAWQNKRAFNVLILELGANDGLRGLSPAKTKQNLAGIVAKLRSKKPKLRILLAGMKVPPNMGEEYAEAYEKIFPQLAKELEVELIPFFLEGVAGEVSMNLPDGIHPNENGHEKVAALVFRYLMPIKE